MKDKICATLTKDHIYICDGGVIGRSGENECTQLEITLDECLCDKWIYIDFSKPDGTTYKTPKLDVIGNKVIYDIPNALLDQKGQLKVQVVLQDENGEVWKSTIKSYGVNPSINATDDIENKDDFITEAQRLLNEVEEGLTPTIGDNGNWFILDKDTGKTSIGPQGEKGEKGDAGSIKFIIANELPTENIDENAIYMKPSGEIEGNTYEEYIYVNGTWESLGSASVNVDLADYVKKTDYATGTTPGLATIAYNKYTSGLDIKNGMISISGATEEQIDAKSSKVQPIVPANLDYAVKSVVGGHITLTQAEYDALETKDENTYYYIVEE